MSQRMLLGDSAEPRCPLRTLTLRAPCPVSGPLPALIERPAPGRDAARSESAQQTPRIRLFKGPGRLFIYVQRKR